MAPAIYSSGKNAREQKAARQFLEAVGVREVGETEKIEAILNERYSYEADVPDEQTHQRDLLRFIQFANQNPDSAKSLFEDYCIFMTDVDDWRTPEEVYLDQPFLDTGLSAYYSRLKGEHSAVPLCEIYCTMNIPLRDLGRFASIVGARKRLEIVKTSIRNNPDAAYLRAVSGERFSSPINRDYFIPGLERQLQKPDIELSGLLWRTMSGLPSYSEYFWAVYQKNASHGPRRAPSQFVHQLKSASWVPQREGEFVPPRDASPDLLPPGFAFDKGEAWLERVGFGETKRELAASKQQRQALAQQLGFADEEAFVEAQWFANLPSDERHRLRSDYERHYVEELPEQESRNPEHRSRQVLERAQSAPGRESELRSRSVAIGYAAIKQEAEQYLRQQYTINGVMICQACRHALPFRLEDGTYYVEKVELVSGLSKRHYQNHIALCPNHAAMFQHANGSRDNLRSQVIEGSLGEIQLVLAQEETPLHFTAVHLNDLKAVLESEAS